jgi:hypothetical protein
MKVYLWNIALITPSSYTEKLSALPKVRETNQELPIELAETQGIAAGNRILTFHTLYLDQEGMLVIY